MCASFATARGEFVYWDSQGDRKSVPPSSLAGSGVDGTKVFRIILFSFLSFVVVVVVASDGGGSGSGSGVVVAVSIVVGGGRARARKGFNLPLKKGEEEGDNSTLYWYLALLVVLFFLSFMDSLYFQGSIFRILFSFY